MGRAPETRSGPPSPRILLLVGHRRNRELLQERLASRHVVTCPAPQEVESALDGPLDLVVLDGPRLERWGEAVRARRRREHPVLLPVVLVASRTRLERAMETAQDTVDEVIGTPVSLLELHTRMRTLLRLRATTLLLARRERQVSRSCDVFRTMAAGIAHDFNNLLGPILGFLELSVSELPSEHPVQENLRQAIQAASRARELSHRFLALGKRPSGTRRSVRMDRTVQEALDLLRIVAPRDVELTLEVDGAPLCVRADPVELHRIVVNLGTNGLQAMEGRGRLRIRLARVPSDTIESARTRGKPSVPAYALLEVEDNGSGIDPEHLDEIFLPYYSTRPDEHGTGLGLAVTKGIVEAWGGRIEVQSRLGEGTTFRVYLPEAEPLVAEPA